MEFKIKMKANLIAFLVFLIIMMVFGGILIGLALSDPADPITEQTYRGAIILIGIGWIVLVGSGLIGCLKTISRDTAEIDIDSFTEAEVQNAIEKRWQEVKASVSNKEFKNNGQ